MIEKYFKLGIRYRWTKPADVGTPQDGALVDSTRAASPMQYIGLGAEAIDPMLMTTHVRTLGLTMNMPVQHQWLDYALGQTARVPMGPYDVLTGFMSGCIIARWQERGVTYAGHLGTVVADATVNRKVKRTFSFAMPRSTTAFNPADAWGFGELSTLMRKFNPQPHPNIMAMVTTRGEFYSIVMLNMGNNEWYCGGAKRCTPIPHDTLKLQLLRD